MTGTEVTDADDPLTTDTFDALLPGNSPGSAGGADAATDDVDDPSIIDKLDALLPGNSPGSVRGKDKPTDDAIPATANDEGATTLEFSFGKPPSPPQADKPNADTINENNTKFFITATMLIKSLKNNYNVLAPEMTNSTRRFFALPSSV